MEVGSNSEIRKTPDLVQELFGRVLYDEQPLFISDESTIWDVSVLSEQKRLGGCSRYYGMTDPLERISAPSFPPRERYRYPPHPRAKGQSFDVCRSACEKKACSVCIYANDFERD